MLLDRDLSRHRIRRSRPGIGRVAPIALVCLLAACGGGDLVLPGADDGVQIRVVDGDGQRGSIGQPLTAPVVVEVTDEAGDPAGRGDGPVRHHLRRQPAPRSLHRSARTGQEGRAQAHILLGDKIGLQTGEASVVVEGGAAPTTSFSALAVPVAGGNDPPRSEFDWSCDGLTCRFTESSSDADGEVAGWSWQFGDGSTSTDREPTHRYNASGSYTVTLTVTDDEGATDASSHQVNPTAPGPTPPSNQAPKAEFEVTCEDLRCSFTDRSTDEDGSIESRAWTFGDGATSSQRNPSHSYASAGQYDVTLVVTDDDGATDSRTRTAAPESPPDRHRPPAVQPAAAGRVRGRVPGAPLHLRGPERGRRRQRRELGMGFRGWRHVERAKPVALVRIAGELRGAAPRHRRRRGGRHPDAIRPRAAVAAAAAAPAGQQAAQGRVPRWTAAG